MSNYIKSELYKLKKSKLLWIFVIWVLFEAINDPFASSEGVLKWVSFGMIEAYHCTIILTLIVLGNEFRNKTFNNTIAGGISENKTYFGKIIVTSIVGVIILALSVISSIIFNLLLHGKSELKYVQLVCESTAVILVPCFAAIVLAVTIKYITRSNIVTTFIWWFLSCEIHEVLGFLPMDKINRYLSLSKVMHVGSDIDIGVFPDGLSQSWHVQEGIIPIVVASVLLIMSCIVIKLKIKRSVNK